MEKKIVWLDMDGVLVNFRKGVDEILERNPEFREKYKGEYDRMHGVFRNPPPIDGAIEAVKKLVESGKYELYIASTAPWDNPESATDKRYWIEKHFGKLFEKKMCITHLKNMLIGDYLIDDRTANGAGEFKGELIHFGYDYVNDKFNEYPDWDSVLKKLL